MTLYINDRPEIFKDDEISIAELMLRKGISSQGTAIALNGKLVVRSKWDSQLLADNDKLTVITAAFGG